MSIDFINIFNFIRIVYSNILKPPNFYARWLCAGYYFMTIILSKYNPNIMFDNANKKGTTLNNKVDLLFLVVIKKLQIIL